jgi:hypothetical protein
MKNILFLTAALFLLYACGNDNPADENTVKTDSTKVVDVKTDTNATDTISMLCGTWRMTDYSANKPIPAKYKKTLEKQKNTSLYTIRPDGTYLVVTGKKNNEGTWSLNGNNLCFTTDKKADCRVLKTISAKQIVLTMEPAEGAVLEMIFEKI